MELKEFLESLDLNSVDKGNINYCMDYINRYCDTAEDKLEAICIKLLHENPSVFEYYRDAVKMYDKIRNYCGLVYDEETGEYKEA